MIDKIMGEENYWKSFVPTAKELEAFCIPCEIELNKPYRFYEDNEKCSGCDRYVLTKYQTSINLNNYFKDDICYKQILTRPPISPNIFKYGDYMDCQKVGMTKPINQCRRCSDYLITQTQKLKRRIIDKIMKEENFWIDFAPRSKKVKGLCICCEDDDTTTSDSE